MMYVCSVFLSTDILQIFTLESLYLDDDATTFFLLVTERISIQCSLVMPVF